MGNFLKATLFGRKDVTNANLEPKAGFDTFTDPINEPNPGPETGWPWYRITIKLLGNLLGWRTELAIHFINGRWFERLYNAQTGVLSAWFRVHSNRWFPVSETMLPANGDLFYYNGTSWTRLPKGTDGQTLKMVSGVPTWTT